MYPKLSGTHGSILHYPATSGAAAACRRSGGESQPVGDDADDDAADPHDPLVGESIGVWKLVERLPKQGAMSTVYRGERADGRYSQAVAVKLFEKDERELGGGARPLPPRKVALLGQLRHPSTVRLDAGATGERAAGAGDGMGRPACRWTRTAASGA